MKQLGIFDHPESPSYFQTTEKTVSELITAEKKAKRQEDIALEIFKKNSPLSPSQALKIWCKGNKAIPLTSLRRALSNLTRDGLLVKTNILVDGMYGEREHLWKIN